MPSAGPKRRLGSIWRLRTKSNMADPPNSVASRDAPPPRVRRGSGERSRSARAARARPPRAAPRAPVRAPVVHRTRPLHRAPAANGGAPTTEEDVMRAITIFAAALAAAGCASGPPTVLDADYGRLRPEQAA